MEGGRRMMRLLKALNSVRLCSCPRLSGSLPRPEPHHSLSLAPSVLSLVTSLQDVGCGTAVLEAAAAPQHTSFCETGMASEGLGSEMVSEISEL